ncbi:uncharacterized protein G2W53_011961 [Senna tora]|uniref:Uncharacterized protein n=1 Tax=Senna tora TaxID=362788 RepID=A0A834TWA7_9FABA|nr:uncharacterized protein G2W53_011961 [Senna tora]
MSSLSRVTNAKTKVARKLEKTEMKKEASYEWMVERKEVVVCLEGFKP